MPENVTEMETKGPRGSGKKRPRVIIDPGATQFWANGVIVLDSDDEKAPEDLNCSEYGGFYDVEN
jgi:hypothetical protein